MKPATRFFKYFIGLFLGISLQSKAQEDAGMPKKDTAVLYSKILKEDRSIYISYPTTLSDKKYPVLFLLDGESHFNLVAEYVSYLSRWDVNAIPELIVVGIANTKRARDLTPTQSIIDYYGRKDTSVLSSMKPNGGNEAFLQFIRDELFPYIDSHYQTGTYRILAGHSFGGLATLNCLFTQPGMFNDYIAISPSLWWDGGYMLQLAGKKIKKGAVLNKQLFFSDGNEGQADSTSFHSNLLKLKSLLATRPMKGFEYRYKYYPSETHMSVPAPAYYDALAYIFRKWRAKK